MFLSLGAVRRAAPGILQSCVAAGPVSVQNFFLTSVMAQPHIAVPPGGLRLVLGGGMTLGAIAAPSVFRDARHRISFLPATTSSTRTSNELTALEAPPMPSKRFARRYLPPGEALDSDLAWWIAVSKKRTLALVARLLLSEYSALLMAISASLIAAYMQVLIPLQIKALLAALIVKSGDQGSEAISHGPVLRKAFESARLLLGYYFVHGVSGYAAIASVGALGEAIALRLRLVLYNSLIRKKMVFFDEHSTIDCLERLNNDIYEFKSSLKQIISGTLKSTTQFLGATVSLYAISPVFTAYAAMGVPTLVLSGTMLASLMRPLSRAAQHAVSDATSVSSEALLNIRTVKAFGTEDYEQQRYAACAHQIRNLSMRVAHAIGIFQASTQFILNATNLGVLAYGASLVVKGQLAHADLTCLLLAANESQKSVALFASLYAAALKISSSLTRVKEHMFVAEEPRYTSSPKGESLAPSTSELQMSVGAPAWDPVTSVLFDNVTFKYPTRPESVVLDGVTLVAEAGKVTALVGPSGSGKSTLVQLLERFYDVEQGNIYVGSLTDHSDVADIPLNELRKEWVGYIAQEPVLFHGTIRENIAYARPEATDAEVLAAAKTANAHAFIDQFPDKYDTVLSERGLSLSGGQKQRIAIARALLKQPKILILDEATSALDQESERLVQAALETVQRGRTTIIIAHRLSTIQNADKIVYMQNGRILEQGSHNQLMSIKGHYYQMVNSNKSSSSV